MTTPDTTTSPAPDETTTTEATGAVTEPVATETASEATSEATSDVTAEAKAETPAAASAAPAGTAVATTTANETVVAAPVAEEEEEDPQTTVFSLLTFFLAAIPLVGVVLNAIAVKRAGKEGFDLWLARWGLALSILETLGALILVGLGYWLGFATATA